MSGWHIKKDESGKYFLIRENNDVPIEIETKAVEALILSGIEIKEE